jgi:hypothetical protein
MYRNGACAYVSAWYAEKAAEYVEFHLQRAGVDLAARI